MVITADTSAIAAPVIPGVQCQVNADFAQWANITCDGSCVCRIAASGRLGSQGSSALVGVGAGCQGSWSVTNGWVAAGQYQQHLMFGTPHLGGSSSTCTSCPAGTFSNATAESSCSSCLAGSYSSTAGSIPKYVYPQRDSK
jgi:hypothetical protein